MKKFMLAAVLTMVVAVPAVFAAEQTAAQPKKELTGQQLKMRECNATAKTQSLKGDERKAFMKECLSGDKTGKTDASDKPAASKPASAKKSAQTGKMKTCNADAKAQGFKGAERKAFMKECLRAA